MGPLEHPGKAQTVQGGRRVQRRPRRRRCLLKGCERAFTPENPFERYCSDRCRERARRWSRWRAQLRYRRSANGKKRRRDQSRRYRRRQREKKEKRESGDETDVGGTPEGHQCRKIFERSTCKRPGCYELFAPTPRSPLKTFCSCLCRRALRRVIEREKRWRREGRSLG